LGRLEVRFRELLTGRGVDIGGLEIGKLTDVVRLLLQVSSGSSDESAGRRQAICRVLGERVRLPAADVELLVRLAEAPEFRGVVDRREMDAFKARFGDDARHALEQEEQSELDLAGYAARYGAAEALALLDKAFAVIAADGEVDREELRRLEEAAPRLGIDQMLFAALNWKHDPKRASGEWAVPITGEAVRIGRSPGSDVVLADPQVALRHAEIVRSGGSWRVVDQGSGRPTVLNGRPVSSAPLGGGDELRVGPYLLRLDEAGRQLKVWGERSFAALTVRHLTRTIGEVSLLDDVSFTVFSGEVVAMIGPSGCGKTTLLNAIAGVTRADSGEVLFDGTDFHALLQADRSRVGIVPQDDIVHPELTVEESLYFSGRLRFSPDTTDAELRAEVDRVLAELGIEHIRRSRIGDALRRGISGGQRKRVNLGQELLTRSTRVLFLDEPTSGLDPRASQDIVRLVRQLADRGRIVFIVTHDLTPQVIAQVDHLLVLAPGGRLAFFGPPADACRYFGVETPDAIFNRFTDRPPAEWGAVYRESPASRKFVQTREHLLGMHTTRPEPTGAVAAVRRSLRGQLITQVRRYAKVKLRDVGGLTVLMAQAPILALVMRVVFPQPTKEMLFMLSLSCLWFGMSAAVRELISDRVIWLRERRVGVGSLPYVSSKVAVLGGFVTLQCWVFAALNLALQPVLLEWGFSAEKLLAVTALTGLCGMSLGLLVSALNSSSEGAVGMLPLLLIPQISFSGMLLSLRKMTSMARTISAFDPARYSYEAMLKVATWRDAVPGEPGLWHWSYGRIASPPTRGQGDWDVLGVQGTLYDLGFKGVGEDDLLLTSGAISAILVMFTLGFFACAWARVHRRRAD
jgi:ABC-type multidrug transport system ATPase subunit